MAQDGVRVWSVLVAMALLGACSSNNGTPPPNGGTGGAGDPSTGAGGDAAPGNDGATPGAEGFGGHGDGVPTSTAVDTSLAPSNGLIADFVTAGAAGLEISGIVRAAGWGDATPTATTTGGRLHIVENAPESLKFSGAARVLLLFDSCIDATGFTGLQFSISGAASPCTLLYAPMDSEHVDSATTGGGGPANAVPPYVDLAPAHFSPMVRIPFAGSGAPANGTPNTPIDRAKLVGMEWVFLFPVSVTTAGAPVCTADLSIDNIAFYR